MNQTRWGYVYKKLREVDPLNQMEFQYDVIWKNVFLGRGGVVFFFVFFGFDQRQLYETFLVLTLCNCWVL